MLSNVNCEKEYEEDYCTAADPGSGPELAACGEKTPDPTKPVKDPTTVATDPVDTTPSEDATEGGDQEAITVENPIVSISLSMGENFDNVNYVNAYPNPDDEESVYIEYVGAEKKVGILPNAVMHAMTVELEKTELATLNGQDNYGDGDANASMYIEFADGTALAVNYTGEIPEAFVNGYNAMDAHFQTLTADMEVYVPQPVVMDGVDEAMLNAAMDILNGSGMPNLDGIAIAPLATDDEFFGEAAGLSSADGIAKAVSVAPMMMSQAYSLVIVELAEGADAAAIGADFENKIDWMKWVCVAPSNALIATKDNMVMCLQAADNMYTMTVAGIDAAGWTHVNELTNPEMG